MTTYTAIANADIDADSPVTAPLMTAMRDNPIAITEGASGAPKIQDAALDTTVTSAGTDWVLARVSQLTAGVVGSFAFAQPQNTTSYTFGQTIAGSSLSPAAVNPDGGSSLNIDNSGTLSGTWRCLGVTVYNITPAENGATLWLRIV
jgi:hypothetical protein